MELLLGRGQRVLFQGDSITDADRRYDQPGDLGLGYAYITAARLAALYPELELTFLNRGVSGNRAVDLKARWQADCIDLQPDWVSILIGINDTWRAFDSGDPTSAAAFEDTYGALMADVKKRTNARLIILEPFVLPVTAEMATTWREDLDPKIQAARRLAREYAAVYVPCDGLFAAACHRAPAAYWAEDGVHPSPAGRALMADHWLRSMGAIE